MKFFVQPLFSVHLARIVNPLIAMSLIVISLIIASSSSLVQANANLDTQEMRFTSAHSSTLTDGALIEMNFDGAAASSANRIARRGVIYVKADATGANNGTSWANAYTDLQNALMGAFAGNEIWVAAGTYKPSGGADRTVSFQIKSGVALYGGFNGTETTRDERNWETNQTILSGDLNGNDNNNVDANEPTRADNSNHVVISSGADSNAVLDGFIISAGNANDSGGGMYNFGNSRVTVNNVTFTRNSAHGNGEDNSNLELYYDCTKHHGFAVNIGFPVNIDWREKSGLECQNPDRLALYQGVIRQGNEHNAIYIAKAIYSSRLVVNLA